MKFEYEKEEKRFQIKIPKGFEKFAVEELPGVLIYDRYNKEAFCTKCEKHFDYSRGKTLMFDFKADDYVRCPICGEKLTAEPYKRYICRQANIIIAEEKEEILRLGVMHLHWEVERTKPEALEMFVNVNCANFFQIGEKEQKMFIKHFPSTWIENDNIYLPYYLYEASFFPGAIETIKNGKLKHTFEFVEKIIGVNYKIKAIALLYSYPQSEYIIKQGLGWILTNRIYDVPSYIRPNWKAKNKASFLRMTHQEYDKLCQWNMLDRDSLPWYYALRNFTKPTKRAMEELKNNWLEIDEYNKYCKKHNPLKISRYLHTVYEENQPACGHGAYGYNKYGVLDLYNDYLRQAKELGYPMNDYYMYPKDFTSAHDKISAEYNEMLDKKISAENAEKDKTYKKRLEKLEKLAYSGETYLIRPLRGIAEFQKEGRENKNCVASYFERALNGSTNIFVIRKTENQGEAFITLELKNGEIVQCFGKGNSLPSQEVKDFADWWLENIVKKKGKKVA